MIQLPVIEGLLDRRILLNYRFDPDALEALIPPPFEPRIHKGHAIGGICMIRFRRLRPRRFPAVIGVDSENAAHRIAVEWEAGNERKEGVFIPQRDTASPFNHWAGARPPRSRRVLEGHRSWCSSGIAHSYLPLRFVVAAKWASSVTKRRMMKSVLHGFLGTYTSRYADHRGYWLHGQLPLDPPECTFDLLGSTSHPDRLTEVARHLAVRRFADQLHKAGLTPLVIREARLHIARIPGRVEGRQGDYAAIGQRVRFSVQCVMDDGRVYQDESVVFIAPHDPARERRRLEAGWGRSGADAES